MSPWILETELGPLRTYILKTENQFYSGNLKYYTSNLIKIWENRSGFQSKKRLLNVDRITQTVRTDDELPYISQRTYLDPSSSVFDRTKYTDQSRYPSNMIDLTEHDEPYRGHERERENDVTWETEIYFRNTLMEDTINNSGKFIDGHLLLSETEPVMLTLFSYIV